MGGERCDADSLIKNCQICVADISQCICYVYKGKTGIFPCRKTTIFVDKGLYCARGGGKSKRSKRKNYSCTLCKHDWRKE